MSAISDLKSALGKQLGTRTNKYLIEIPVPTVNGRTIAYLCKNASFPERNNNTSEVFHMGRKVVKRGETDYTNEYQVTFYNDSNMAIRKMFDTWAKLVDDSSKKRNSGLLGSSVSETTLNNIEAGVTTTRAVLDRIQNTRQVTDFFLNYVDVNKGFSDSGYQIDINIWQLGANQELIYGYKIQGAFPKNISSIDYNADELDKISEFTVTFAFQEFIPIHTTASDVGRGVYGDILGDVVDTL